MGEVLRSCRHQCASRLEPEGVGGYSPSQLACPRGGLGANHASAGLINWQQLIAENVNSKSPGFNFDVAPNAECRKIESDLYSEKPLCISRLLSGLRVTTSKRRRRRLPWRRRMPYWCRTCSKPLHWHVTTDAINAYSKASHASSCWCATIGARAAHLGQVRDLLDIVDDHHSRGSMIVTSKSSKLDTHGQRVNS